MSKIGQKTAGAGAFTLPGHGGPLLTAPVTSEDERAFVLEPDDPASLRHVRVIEQVLQQLLDRKVVIIARSDAWEEPVPFE